MWRKGCETGWPIRSARLLILSGLASREALKAFSKRRGIIGESRCDLAQQQQMKLCYSYSSISSLSPTGTIEIFTFAFLSQKCI